MKIAVDKNTYKVAKKDGNEYIYLFDKESLEELLATKLHCIKYTECGFVDINTTQYNIDCIKKVNIEEKNWKNLPIMKNYKIGIIIPNYNYEHTIKKCLESIFNQTYQNFEIIFVDDMSTDNSVQIASETYSNFLSKQTMDKDFGELKIIKLKQKRLNGGARNEAYLHLSDDVDYVYYVDSDDWLYDETALETINLKLQQNPDVLFVGMARWRNNELSIEFIPEYKDKYEAMLGWSGSCGKVIRKSLATRQECLYNEGTLKEDKNQHCKICIYMETFDNLRKPIYVWNQMNTKSVTTIREKVIWGTSTIRHYADTLQLALSVKGMDPRIDEIMDERVRKTKLEVERNRDRQW